MKTLVLVKLTEKIKKAYMEKTMNVENVWNHITDT